MENHPWKRMVSPPCFPRRRCPVSLSGGLFSISGHVRVAAGARVRAQQDDDVAALQDLRSKVPQLAGALLREAHGCGGWWLVGSCAVAGNVIPPNRMHTNKIKEPRLVAIMCYTRGQWGNNQQEYSECSVVNTCGS